MASRGIKLVQMAIDSGHNLDDTETQSNEDGSSDSKNEAESELKFDLIEQPMLNNNSDNIKKTATWINENDFNNAEVDYPEKPSKENDNLKCQKLGALEFSKVFKSSQYEIEESDCSYISPSEADDSDKDKHYLPDNDDLSSLDVPIMPELKVKAYDSFEHRSLSPESSDEFDYCVKKKDKIFILSDVTIQESLNGNKKGASRKKIVNNLKKDQEVGKQTNKKSNKRDINNFSSKSQKTKKETTTKLNDLQSNNDDSTMEPLSSRLQKKKQSDNKLIQCKFCNGDIATKNFMRHLKRRHNDENEVKRIFNYPMHSKKRRQAFAILRNDTNFNLYMTGLIRPNRHCPKEMDKGAEYFPCVHCKGIFTKKYLKRHAKSCFLRDSNQSERKVNELTLSQTAVACAMDPTQVISKLNIKEQVFNIMKADDIAFEAKKDLLIAHFGESYMKKHKRERMVYACSNRMRELSRLLISFRQITKNENTVFAELLHPKNFDNILFATRRIVGYDYEKKSFKAPSLAMHLGTSLKLACDELITLILKQSRGFQCKTAEDAKLWMTNVKNFKKLVEGRWNIEMGSLANKELQQNKWKKPLLLPLVHDIKKFRDEVTKLAEESVTKLTEDPKDKSTFKMLNKCALSLLILFNRRRIGDVQYLKINDYKEDRKSNYTDFENALTETEKVLTTQYKRVVNSGKGSRAVVILIPKEIEKMINTLLEYRNEHIVDKENQYVFAMPDSKIKWGKGDVAIRELSKKIKLENPEAISSNKLRKQIATVTQILNLKPQEAKQFANFMGHTQKTHDEFYELPVDIYQTAKISKLLLMMEKGTVPVEHKGKSLEEINIDPNLEYAEEDILDNEHHGTVNNEAPPGFYAHEPVIGLNPVQDLNIVPNVETEDIGVSSVNEPNNDLAEDDNENVRLKRNYWSNNELHLLKKEFSSYIRKGCYPPGEVIKQFIEKTGSKRTVMVIKSKIQHLIKMK